MGPRTLVIRPASLRRSNQALMNLMQRRKKEQERRKRQKREGKEQGTYSHHVIATITN